MEATIPTTASATRMPQREMINAVSFFKIPLSIIEATTSGTINSKAASSILKRGASTLSIL